MEGSGIRVPSLEQCETPKAIPFERFFQVPLALECAYLEGQGDLVNRLIMGITRVTIRVIGVINLLTNSPRPSK